VVVAVVVTRAALRLASVAADGWMVTPISYVAAFVLGGLIGSLAVGVYLTATSAIWGAEANHAFSAQRRPDHRNFVRLHVRDDGALDLYAIGVDRAGRRWRAVPDGGDEDAWAEPADQPLAPHLIERITVPGDDSAPPVSPST
jgi:hypothetical protein